MTDLSVTAASVLAGANAPTTPGLAGEAITAGKAVYLDPTSKKWQLADNNSATAAQRQATGIALNGAALNQPLKVQTSGPITIGAALTAGAAYYLSAIPGGICPLADVTTGDYVCLLGLAASATVLNIDIQYPGVSN